MYWFSIIRYNHARLIRDAQDAYCSSALSGDWASIVDTPFPEDLQWEALVDVLRGKVKVHVHCYETVDLDDIVRVRSSFLLLVDMDWALLFWLHIAHQRVQIPDCGIPPCSWDLPGSGCVKKGIRSVTWFNTKCFKVIILNLLTQR